MAINMLDENEYTSCLNCKNKTFTKVKSFALRRLETPSGVKLKRESITNIYVCSKCGEDVTKSVGKNEII